MVWTFVVVCCSAEPVAVAVAAPPPAVTLETAVTMPGLTPTNSAQMPMKYSNADFSSSSDADHACTHEITRRVNCDDGQKHSVSLLDEQSGRRLSQVFRQRGTRFGQSADCVGAGPGEDDDDTPGDWTYVVTEGLGFEETEIGIRLRLELELEPEPELEAVMDDVAAGGMASVVVPSVVPEEEGVGRLERGVLLALLLAPLLSSTELPDEAIVDEATADRVLPAATPEPMPPQLVLQLQLPPPLTAVD